MAVPVEPSRVRLRPDPGRYPGLTVEERGFDPAPPSPRATPPETGPPPSVAPDPSPPLWVVPSEVPRASRSLGFAGAYPEPILPDPPEPEGLFDVPGLLERLWLARALEAQRERPWSAEPPASGSPERPDLLVPSSGAKSGGVFAVGPSSAPAAGVPTAAPGSSNASVPPESTIGPGHALGFRPKSWVCPYCYLANDASASTCRGCRSSSLHF
jgi:hypothetical protein